MQSSTGSTSLLSALAVPGSACTTGRGSSGCRGKAHFGSDASSNFNSTDIYMLVMFTDGGRWNKLLAGRESDNYARISVTYCISAAGAHLFIAPQASVGAEVINGSLCPQSHLACCFF